MAPRRPQLTAAAWGDGVQPASPPGLAMLLAAAVGLSAAAGVPAASARASLSDMRHNLAEDIQYGAVAHQRQGQASQEGTAVDSGLFTGDAWLAMMRCARSGGADAGGARVQHPLPAT